MFLIYITIALNLLIIKYIYRLLDEPTMAGAYSLRNMVCGHYILFFIVAPLVATLVDYSPTHFSYLPGNAFYIREYVTLWNMLNAVGLVFVVGILYYRPASRGRGDVGKGCRKIRWIKLKRYSIIYIVFFATIKILVILSFGGPSAYSETYFNEGAEAFSGLGVVFLLTDSVPLVGLMTAVLFYKARRVTKWFVLCVFFCYIFTMPIFVGLLGSRSAILFGMVLGLGLLGVAGIKLGRTLTITLILTSVIPLS